MNLEQFLRVHVMRKAGPDMATQMIVDRLLQNLVVNYKKYLKVYNA